MRNLILATDSYKASHFLQYPKGTRHIWSYIEPRYSSISDKVVHFGLQMFLKEYLSKPVTHSDIEEAEDIFAMHGEPFNKEGWQYIVDRYGGYLPLYITAAPEGTVLPLHNVQVQVNNSDPKVPWLTSYVETMLLRAVWYPSTVATISREAKKKIMYWLQKTCDDPQGQIMFRLHDFGARGCTSAEQAGIGGVAHLVNFMGTDTVEALTYARRYYNEKMPGYSIPAAEHSTIMAWKNESAAFNNMIDKFSGDGKLYAVVSDTYDIFNAVDEIWCKELGDKVESSGGTLVIRPDSGDPVTVVTYIAKALAMKFGFTINSKGFRVLNPCVRIIQSDGVNLNSIVDILADLAYNGFSAENIAFGMGAGLLQKCNRDTFGYAMKACAIQDEDYTVRDISKNPITAKSTKTSKAGVLALVNDNGLKTVRELDRGERENLLVPVYHNGDILKEWSLAEIRENAKLY